MINMTLYKREMKGSLKILILFAVVITMYVTIIISMYDPEMMATLDGFYEVMPELMASIGMSAGATSLIGFMISYLYGFILLIFPMVFCILRGNSLVAKYTDKGSMVTLLAAPIKRRTIILTQIFVLMSGILLLIIYVTGLEIIIAQTIFPGELIVSDLLKLNTALLCLHLFIGSICFLASCVFSDTKYSIAFGAGVSAFMYILQMLANAGEKADILKYFTFFTLFDANGIIAGKSGAIIGILVLLLGTIGLSSVPNGSIRKEGLSHTWRDSPSGFGICDTAR